MKRAALYARVSSERQKQEQTIESQVAELERQIRATGHVLVKEYIDDGHSGKYLDRPALDALRGDLKADLFEAVYFLDADRIARTQVLQTIVIDEILKAGKRVIASVTKCFNNAGRRHISRRTRSVSRQIVRNHHGRFSKA